MSDVHAILGAVVLVTNLLAGVWGGVAWVRREPSVVFWYLLRAAQVVVVVQVLIGLLLLAGGRRAPGSLHFLYGIAPLVVALVSETMRVGAAQRELAEAGDVEALERREQALLARRVVQREMGIMSVGALLIVTLALRAVGTGGGLL
ncbi:MAG: hypothetical protein H0U12_13200 [Thermoleophilaceae bacterium]|nr:hypothetical protein [Thermoleophilaceae bacterium]